MGKIEDKTFIHFAAYITTMNQDTGSKTVGFSEERYDRMSYRRVGKSGLKLPAISLGMWHNFGPNDSLSTQRDLLRCAFDHGITHFDLADNYGGGAAERHVGAFLKEDFAHHRDELVISTKAGHGMWLGPYGDWGSRKHLISGLDQSLTRLQLDYVDIFYHHRPDPETPIEETAQALADIVRQGKALYIGISNYYGAQSREMIAALQKRKTPCLINQLPFNLLDRNAAESGELAALEKDGVGAIAFCPLAQGLLSGRYLKGIPQDSRAALSGTCLDEDRVTADLVVKLQGLNAIAKQRGQSLSQMALSWVLSHAPIASVLIGASRPEQIVQNVGSLQASEFSAEECRQIEDTLGFGATASS